MNRKHFYIIAGIFILALAGCSIKKEDTKKIQDIEFTVVAPEDIPEELKEDIEKARDTPFRLTYADQGYLYIARGYGEKEKTGYSVEATHATKHQMLSGSRQHFSVRQRARRQKKRRHIRMW